MANRKPRKGGANQPKFVLPEFNLSPPKLEERQKVAKQLGNLPYMLYKGPARSESLNGWLSGLSDYQKNHFYSTLGKLKDDDTLNHLQDLAEKPTDEERFQCALDAGFLPDQNLVSQIELKLDLVLRHLPKLKPPFSENKEKTDEEKKQEWVEKINQLSVWLTEHPDVKSNLAFLIAPLGAEGKQNAISMVSTMLDLTDSERRIYVGAEGGVS